MLQGNWYLTNVLKNPRLNVEPFQKNKGNLLHMLISTQFLIIHNNLS